MHESMHLKVEHFLELALTHPNSTSSHVSMQQSTGILVPPPSIPPPPPISAQSNSAVKTQPLSALSSPIVNVKNNSISLTLSHTTPPTEQTKTDIVKELNTYIGTLGENEVLLPSKVFAKSLLTLKSAQSNPI